MKYLKNNKKAGFLIHFDINIKLGSILILILKSRILPYFKNGPLIFQIWTSTFWDMLSNILAVGIDTIPLLNQKMRNMEI